jgi:hypothetical protein
MHMVYFMINVARAFNIWETDPNNILGLDARIMSNVSAFISRGEFSSPLRREGKDRMLS